MPHSQYERVSAFKEDTMTEVDHPKLTPRSSYSTGLERSFAKQSAFNYKPLILRTVPLLSLLALTLGLIGLLEYAHAQLPHGEVKLRRRDADWQVQANKLSRRSASRVPVVLAVRASNSSSSTIPPPAYTTDTSAYVDDQVTMTLITATSAYVDDEFTTTIAASNDRTAFVPAEETTTIQDDSEVSIDTASPSAYVPGASTTTISTSIQLDTVYSVFVPEVTSETITDGVLLRPTMPPGSMSKSTSAFVPPTTTVLDDQDGGSSGSTDDEFDDQSASVDSVVSGQDGVVVKVFRWSPNNIFLGNYLAVCIAVVYRLFWVVLYNAFNLIEPFRQLISREGAAAETVLFAFYQSQSNLLGPIPALMKKSWALALVASAYLVVTLLPALASESVFVDTDWGCENPREDTNNPCNPRIMANGAIVRALQGLLGFCTVVLLFTTSLLLFNKTGLPTRPNSIATVASLMRHPRLLADMSGTPVNARDADLQRLMAGKRYRMGHYTCANGLQGYGIQPWNGYDSETFGSQPSASRHQYAPIDGSSPFGREEGRKTHRPQLKDYVLAVFLLGTFGVVLAYYLDGNKDGFNDFFNSNTFGPRFILTLAATCIANMWKSTEQDAVVMAPFKRLNKRPSSAASTVILASTSTPISSTIRTLRHRYFLASSITILTLAGEALNIVISGIPYANGQRHIQFIVSTYMSMAILALMIVVTAFVIAMRFREPKIPRNPTTLGAVMSYLCSSRILDDFEGTECLNERTRNERIRSLRKKYEFTKTVRRDGKLAWAVDDAFDQPRC